MIFVFISCFLNNVLKIRTFIEHAKHKRPLVVLTGAPKTVGNDTVEMLPLAANKTIKDLSK